MPDPYYERDGIALYLGDARDVLPGLAAGSVDAIITDPPYSAPTHEKQWIGAALSAKAESRVSTKHRSLGFDALTDELRDFAAAECARLCPRWTLVFSDIEGIGGWRGSLEAAGLEYVRTCIWDKVDSAPQFTGDRPAAGAEAIVCAHPPGRKRWNGGGRRNVFRHCVNAVPGGSAAKPHPSTKPLKLISELLTLWSDPGDLILDPFAGSGTVAVAARQLGRRCISIERQERWCEAAALRLESDAPLLGRAREQVRQLALDPAATGGSP